MRSWVAGMAVVALVVFGVGGTAGAAWGGQARVASADVVLPAAAAAGVERIAGASRYEVSALISERTFEPGVPVAYIATGATFADALSGAPAAGVNSSPVLLVPGTSIPAAVAAELRRLEPLRIVILGGANSVSAGVAAQLEGFTSGTIERYSGANRYEVSALISMKTFAPGVRVAYVATGATFADALSGAPAAAVKDSPVLLVPSTGIPPAVATELDRLDPQRIVILGGPNSVSAVVAAQLKDFTGGVVERFSGSDRYEVSALISAKTFEPRVSVAYVATGRTFADALSGAPAAGLGRAPVLLVPGASIPASVGAELGRLKPARVVILGGPNSVAQALEGELARFIDGTPRPTTSPTPAPSPTPKPSSSPTPTPKPTIIPSPTPSPMPTSTPAPAATTCGTISADETWSGTHRLDCVVTVPDGLTVTLAPGAVIQVPGEESGMLVHGTLKAADAGARVRIESYRTEYQTDPDARGLIHVSWSSSELSLRNAVVAGVDVVAEGCRELTVEGSTFTGATLDVQWCDAASVADNDFAGAAHPLKVLVPDVTKVPFTGVRSNTVSGSGADRVVSVNGTVPEGSRFTLAPSSGAVFRGSVSVSGEAIAVAGTIFKGFSYAVGDAGTLAVKGTEAKPVVFTSFYDDSVAGDSDGLGDEVDPAVGAVDDGLDFQTAIGVRATDETRVTIEHADFGYVPALSWYGPFGDAGAVLSLVDSSIDASVQVSSQGEVEIARNDVRARVLADGDTPPAFDLSLSDITGVVFDGPDANIFGGGETASRVKLGNVGHPSIVPGGAGYRLTGDHGAVFSAPLVVDGELSVAPGTVFRGAYLVQQEGGRIAVEGTSERPVVFTSYRDGPDSLSEGSDPADYFNPDGLNSTYDDAAIAVLGNTGTLTVQHAVFDYYRGPAIQAPVTWAIEPTLAELTVEDSTFRSPLNLTGFAGPKSVVRNTFEMREVPTEDGLWFFPESVVLGQAGPVGLALVGAEANRFVGDPRGRIVELGSAALAEGEEWSVGSNGGALLSGALTIHGTVHVEAGAILKSASLRVAPGGTLDVAGTADDPVVFTARWDESIGGVTAPPDDPRDLVPAHVEFLDATVDQGAGISSTIVGAVFLHSAEAVKVGRWNDVQIADSRFEGNGRAVEVTPAGIGDDLGSEMTWALLPCKPPFVSVVGVTNSWMGPSGFAAVDVEASDLVDLFGPSSVPPGVDPDLIDGPMAAAIDEVWSQNLDQVDFTVVDGTDTVPWALYSCSVGSATIAFPWFPVVFQRAATEPYPQFRLE